MSLLALLLGFATKGQLALPQLVPSMAIQRKASWVVERAFNSFTHVEALALEGQYNDEVELLQPDGQFDHVVQSGQEVYSHLSWSSTGRLLTFESSNAGGHSPLTSSGVWIVNFDGKGLRRLTLPAPYSRFSLRFRRWLGPARVEVVALNQTGPLYYVYDYANNSMTLAGGSP